MFHFFPSTKYTDFLCACILSVISLSVFAASNLKAEGSVNQIISITSKEVNSQLEVRIKGEQPLISTVYQLPNPSRIIVDVAEAKLAAGIKPQLTESKLVTLATKEISDATPPITRLEFTLSNSLPYTTAQEGNEIVVTINTQNANPPVAPNQPTENKKQESAALQLQHIKVITKPEQTIVQLLANGELTDYSHDILERKDTLPPRLYIDLNNIIASESLSKEQTVGTAVAKIKVANRGSGLRIVIDSALGSVFPFKIQPIKNGIELLVDEPAAKDQVSSLINQKKGIESQLPEVNPLDAKLSPQASDQQMQDAFNFSGYNKERISVEFLKMDLHNVFNFLRQVSGVNIVVDEAVKGSLTLMLDNVPWDFALDIILNLKDLEKEERFNTIVIYPKGGKYTWPERTDKNLNFQVNTDVMKQEALHIRQQETQSLEVLDAKKTISTAREAEKRENFETAVRLYEQAFEKWPDNVKLANRISSLYLVQLRQSAKALYYAKKALEIDANNSTASLNAAIASANMSDKQKAQEYFDRSINAKKPSKEALQSYAVFSEEQHEYARALKMLEKHDSLYGNDLNAMLTTARIYDKMGEQGKATEKYRAILLSGFNVPPDLQKYIKGRVELKQTM